MSSLLKLFGLYWVPNPINAPTQSTWGFYSDPCHHGYTMSLILHLQLMCFKNFIAEHTLKMFRDNPDINLVVTVIIPSKIHIILNRVL